MTSWTVRATIDFIDKKCEAKVQAPLLRQNDNEARRQERSGDDVDLITQAYYYRHSKAGIACVLRFQTVVTL